jgi:hypothetical protein
MIKSKISSIQNIFHKRENKHFIECLLMFAGDQHINSNAFDFYIKELNKYKRPWFVKTLC